MQLIRNTAAKPSLRLETSKVLALASCVSNNWSYIEGFRAKIHQWSVATLWAVKTSHAFWDRVIPLVITKRGEITFSFKAQNPTGNWARTKILFYYPCTCHFYNTFHMTFTSHFYENFLNKRWRGWRWSSGDKTVKQLTAIWELCFNIC